MDKARSTCLEILSQRNYTISDEDEERIIAIKPDGNEMVVFFSIVPKFNVKNIQSYITCMDDIGIFHAIIVYKYSVTAFTRKAIEQSDEMTFELFSVDDLQYNITKHRLQPHFERLNDRETIDFKELYGTQFGTMKRDDPISNFYGYQKGDVIKVTRSNGYVNYRIIR
jgi:DNA-directed RNA polymerase I, II, and III subunit RPABC1